MFFLLFLIGDRRIQIHISGKWIRIRPKNIWILRIRVQIRNTGVSTGIYLFEERQKAGEDGEEDEKEADISQSGVGLEHGNQSFSRVIMKTCVKQCDGTTAGIDEKLSEKNPGKPKTPLPIPERVSTYIDPASFF